MASKDDVIDQLVAEYRERLERWRDEGFDATITTASDEATRGTFRGVHELDFGEPEYNIVSDGDENPCPHDYLLATVGGCQVTILEQCLQKAGIEEYRIELELTSHKGDHDIDDDIPSIAGMRITDMYADVTVEVPEEHERRASRCAEVFERNCPISQSVEAGIDLHTTAEAVTDE